MEIWIGRFCDFALGREIGLLGYRYTGLWVGLNDFMIYEMVISR